MMNSEPFIYGKVAVKHHFVNRQEELSKLKQNFTGGVSTVLISPRRWGKTSLIQQTLLELKAEDQAVIPCFMDMFNVRSEAEFYQQYANAIIKASSSKWEDWMADAKKFLQALVPKFNLGVDPSTEFTISLDWEEVKKQPDEILNLPDKIGSAKGKRIIVSIDEFQNLQFFEDPEAFQKKLRSHWQYHEHATYCLFGSKRHMLADIFSSSSMPFYKFGDLILLEKIAAKHWVKYVTQTFKQTGKSISKDMVQYMAEKLEGHPYYMQQLARIVWHKTRKQCSMAKVEEGIEDLIAQNALLFERESDELTNTQLHLLQALANGEEKLYSAAVIAKYRLHSSAHVAQAKKALVNKELIDEYSGSIEILDPVFKLWFQQIF